MDQTYLLPLALSAIVALAALGVMRTRSHALAAPGAGESRFAVSTEGMKICPKCGMGNLWTDRTCISCKGPLKG